MTAAHFHCRDLDDLSRMFGNRWAYHLKDLIVALIPPEMTQAQSMKQSGMVGDGAMLCDTVTLHDNGRKPEHAYNVMMLPDKTGTYTHSYNRASWNDLIFRAMACKLAQRMRCRARHAS